MRRIEALELAESFSKCREDNAVAATCAPKAVVPMP